MSYEKNIAIEIKKISDYPIFNSLNKLIVYRIVQESLNNIIKHSGAKNVVIRMDVRQDSINGSVSDDGKGFDADSFMEAKDKSFGLSSMKERAEIAHGSITIKSVVGKGTKIMFSIPNEEEPNE